MCSKEYVAILLIVKSCIHLLSWNKYISIYFLAHNEDIKLIEYDLTINISFNNFQVLNHADLEANLCFRKGFCGQIRNCKCGHIMSMFNINNEYISNKPKKLTWNTNFVQKHKNLKLYTILNQILNKNPKFGGWKNRLITWQKEWEKSRLRDSYETTESTRMSARRRHRKRDNGDDKKMMVDRGVRYGRRRISGVG